jgi:uncharacterized protein
MTVTTETDLEFDPLAGFLIVDCDSHLTEPPDLWTSRAPASYRDRVPQMRTVDGVTAWFLDGTQWAGTGGNTIRVGREKILGALCAQPFEEIDPSSWSVKERLQLLDDLGIYAQVMFPNGIGFSSNHVFAIENENDRMAILRMYNDFLVDIQTESGGRLLPQAMLPIWDMDATIAEMTRLLDVGIRGFTLSDKPELLGLAELPEPYFDPMWDLFNESGAVPNFHVGAGRSRDEVEKRLHAVRDRGSNSEKDTASTGVRPSWRYFGIQRDRSVGAAQLYMSNVRIIANLCMSNLFDRFPNLKIVSAESGIGWVPFLMESLEYQYDEMLTLPDELLFAKRRPSEYFRDHLYVMFWFEKVAVERYLDVIGINNVLVETDIPHPTCYYPGVREHFRTVMGSLDHHVRQRILQDNAAELFRIPLPSP